MTWRRHSAVHEAGHAVIAYLLGMPVDGITLDSDHKGTTSIRWPVEAVHARAVVLLAGYYATTRAYPGTALNALGAGLRPDGDVVPGSDFAAVQALLRGDDGALDRATDDCLALLRQEPVWAMVTALADALVERGWLSSSSLAEVLAAA